MTLAMVLNALNTRYQALPPSTKRYREIRNKEEDEVRRELKHHREIDAKIRQRTMAAGNAIAAREERRRIEIYRREMGRAD